MKNDFSQAAMNVNKGYQKKKWWQRAVSMMTAVVVFCTTYALILPALTMEGEAVCGFEAHEHTESCYTQQQVQVLSCGLDEQAQVVHSHDALCHDAQGVLICPLPEISEHIHGEACMTASEPVLVCGLEETEGHAHSEACSSNETVLICTLEENEAANTGEGEDADMAEPHTHGEACYEVRQIICELPEAEAHIHGDTCYEQQQSLTCGAAEVVPHTHDETCSDCQLPAVVAHSHTESCLVEETRQEMTCQLPVHIHEDNCYPLETEGDASSEYLCGSGEHTHVEGCCDAEGYLICTIPEHTHDVACIVEGLDLTADLETRQQWEKTIAQVQRTGNWPEDVLAVAKSQLGYQESEKNVALVDEDLKGYTRYGQWFGDLYGDWCAMFVSFCLNYAGVEDFPLEAGCNNWIQVLTENELYVTADAYTPKPGDVIFFDYDQKRDAAEEIPVDSDHVGLVAELIPATQTEPAKIKTIEGNTGDQVAYVTYEMDDPAIIGYGVLPTGDTIILTHQGADYTVTVSFGQEAGIPETAQLAVREILPGTDAYNTYYQQSVEELLGKSGTATEEELDVSFARFFDISFVVDGQILEPTAPVDVQISYSDAVEMEERDSGVAVHFAQDGIEVLDAETSQEVQAEDNQVDTFAFTQDSFSVVGTVISTYNTSLGITTATTVDFNSLSATSGSQYVLYTEYNGRYYAITARAGDVTGYSMEVTVNNDGTISWESADSRILWSFSRNGNTGNSYYVQNFGSARYLHAFDNSTATRSDYGTTTGGRNASTLTRQNGGAFIAQGNNYYTGISVAADGTVTFNRVSNQNQAVRFYLALVGEFYNVWFDGTNGGMMSYYGADDTNIPVLKPSGGGEVTVTLPETWQSSTKYDYTLQGWYDIGTQTYYPVDPTDTTEATAKISADTVFYADWVASTYDVGQDNDNVVDSLDTNDFITTHVFDYNVLFNVLSLTHTGSISAADHTESWSIVNNGTVPYNDARSLGFAFVDYDSDGEFSYPFGRDNTNVNQGDAITAGILDEVRNASGQDLLDLLFNPGTDVIGKNYVGTGNYLFQYMDSTTANYDGIHDGYYYLDARLNAASYNQTAQRFYLYNYLERTSDSRKDGGVGAYSDFLPFNSPYLFEEDQLDIYSERLMPVGYIGYEYDAKDGESSFQEYNSVDDATTNYFFGIRSDIEFFLPNDAGDHDEYGNYGNISTRGEHMIFDFHGDDDVWVFIDGELVLDIGGLHGVMFGQIDFSTGTVVSGKDGGTTTTQSFQQILGHNITEGTHTMTVYYMERGSSQSNCAIYFNIAPRYDLEITKEDIVTADKLDGAVFAIYNDEAMTIPAQLWESEEAHKADMEDGTIDDATNEFTVVNGIAKCWGISAGKTYYIYEKTPPPGYPESDDMIRITLNNRGTATIETTTLHGANGVATEGFAVIKQEVNDTLKIVALTVTNQKEGDTTEVRVEKTWAEGSTNLPQSITVYLTADGVPVGRRATLNEGNGWSYTWTGLPKYADEGIDQEIVYEVQEVLVPGYITTQGETVKVENYVDWIRVDQMSDSKTYLLVHNGEALTYDAGGFGWMDPATAEADTSLSAQWNVTTDHDGFHLKNGLGYTLTFSRENQNFYGVDNDADDLNQVFYYLNSRLVVHDHDVYYQFGAEGSAVAEDGLAFTLYQKEVLTGFLTGITNVPVEEEEQTYVEVTKVWSDGNDLHADGAVVVRLYADGQDTGRYVTLSAENNWTGGFYGLPYYQEDGETVVVYTVVEDEIHNYLPEYSDAVQLPKLTTALWREATAISAGDTRYRFTSGSNALAVDVDGNVVSAASDLEDTYQWWEVVDRNGTMVLQNVGSGLYLLRSGTSLSTDDVAAYAAAVSMEDGYVMLDDMYLELSASHAGATYNSANITNQKVTHLVGVEGQYGTGYTVTNLYGVYTLPVTGGMGPSAYAFGGLLILAAALLYICNFGRKRQRGGRNV